MLETNATYWRAAENLVNAWSNYQAKKKLYINATHNETRHKVWKVVMDNYDGDVRKLKYHEERLSIEVDDYLERFEMACGYLGIESVSRDWLYRNLRNAKEYDSLRQKCRRRLNSKKPAQSLKEI